jgi:hypothetical protein
MDNSKRELQMNLATPMQASLIALFAEMTVIKT